MKTIYIILFFFMAVPAFSEEQIQSTTINTDTFFTDNCQFQDSSDIRTHFSNIISNFSNIVIDKYNAKFNLSIVYSDIPILLDNPIGTNPEHPAYYIYDDHSLAFELLPGKEQSEFIKALCENKNQHLWFIYQGQRINQIPHELAHWYHKSFTDKNNLKDNIFHYSTDEVFNKNRLIIEGVAVYLSAELSDESINYNSKYYVNSLENLFIMREKIDAGDNEQYFVNIYKDNFYTAGHSLVKPILDKDFKKGLKYLTEKTPEKFTFISLREYQNNFLNKK